MTRLVSTAWASALLGLAFTGTAFAQTAPEDTSTPTPTAAPPKADVDVDVDVDAPRPPQTTEATAPADVNVNVRAPDTTYVPPPTPVVYDTEDEVYEPLSGIGIGIAAGGGASGFTNDTMRNTTNVGGDWDVRLTLGTRSPLAFEGSYIGSAQSIDALGLDNNAVLLGNGAQGALRLTAPLGLPLQPFIFGGVGWRHYELTNSDSNLSDINDTDDVLEIPMGAGIAGMWNGLMLDARGEFRAATQEDMVPESINRGGSTNNAEMNRWGVKATIGMEF